MNKLAESIIFLAVVSGVVSPIAVAQAPGSQTRPSAAQGASRWGVDAKDFAVLQSDALVRKARVGQQAAALESAAVRGDADAAVLLGVARLYGFEVAKNEASAAQLLEQAAKAGQPRAMAGWSGILLNGFAGVKANPVEGREWARRGAAAGNTIAMTNLGRALEMGLGGAVDLAEATRWAQRAATLGNVPSMLVWGYALKQGRAATASDPGLTKNPAEAAIWFRRGADGGDAVAMHQLGLMLANGEGVARNVDESERWLRAAYKAGDDRALQSLISVLQTQVNASGPNDGPKRRLLLRFTSASCVSCRKAEAAWNDPAFTTWLAPLAKQVIIDADKHADIAKLLGVTPDDLKKFASTTSTPVQNQRRDYKPVLLSVSADNPRRDLQNWFDGEYQSIFTPASQASTTESHLPDLRDPLALAMYAKGCEDKALTESVFEKTDTTSYKRWKAIREALEQWVLHYGYSLRSVADVNVFGVPRPSCAGDLAKLAPRYESLAKDVYSKESKSVRDANMRKEAVPERDDYAAMKEAFWCTHALTRASQIILSDPAAFGLAQGDKVALERKEADLFSFSIVWEQYRDDLAKLLKSQGVNADASVEARKRAFDDRLDSTRAAGLNVFRLYVSQEAELCMLKMRKLEVTLK